MPCFLSLLVTAVTIASPQQPLPAAVIWDLSLPCE
jgi:hypothetical protein